MLNLIDRDKLLDDFYCLYNYFIEQGLLNHANDINLVIGIVQRYEVVDISSIVKETSDES